MKRRNFMDRGTRLLCASLSLGACRYNSRSTIAQSIGESAMKLESKAFTANGTIRAKYTCDGQNISPPLNWENVPEATQRFALIADDPDAPGQTFVHWVLYDLPGEQRELAEEVPPDRKLLAGGVQGRNDFGNLGYGGPCPPSGTHRYFFKLYALDTPLGLEPGATKAQVLAAMEGHILASAELIGRYARQ